MALQASAAWTGFTPPARGADLSWRDGSSPGGLLPGAIPTLEPRPPPGGGLGGRLQSPSPWAPSTPGAGAAVVASALGKVTSDEARRSSAVPGEHSHLEDAPGRPPEHPGVVGNCLICLPENTLRVFGVKANLDDKGGKTKRLWFGRVWQLRQLALLKYRREVLARQQPLKWQDKRTIDEALKDPRKREVVLKMQKVWRGAVARRSASLASVFAPLEYHLAPYAGAVLFMHGSGGMTYNNVRYARTVAAMGYIVIAPDSMAGGEYRHRDVRGHIKSDDKTPYWDDLGLYTSKAEGEYTYDTKAEDVVKNPDKFKKLYENVFRMRSAEMHWILARLSPQMQVRGVFTMGQSEGAMTVARFDDRRYGAMIRGRIISAFSVEYCYFTPNPEAARFGGSSEVATLNIIGDMDQYFGPIKSVAKDVNSKKGAGGWGSEELTGNGFKQMKRQGIRRGLVAVLEGAQHDASETHDNFLRDILRAFLASPHECHKIVEQWTPDVYLTSKIKVVEADTAAGGFRTLIRVGKMDLCDAKTDYGEEIFKRQIFALRLRQRQAADALSLKLAAAQAQGGRGQKADEPAATPRPGAAAEPLSLPGVAAQRGKLVGGAGAMDIRVSLSRGGGTYGFSVEEGWLQRALLVEWVDGTGPLGMWNLRHPADALREGDQILAVNRVSGDPRAMLEELKGASRVELLGRRAR